MSTEAHYGSWKSPITADLITAKGIELREITVDGDDIYWIEGRASEGGRYTIVRRQPDGTVSDCTPPEFYARTTVHEYGGGAFTVADGVIYFANFHDQHLYRQGMGRRPEVLAAGDGYRYADLEIDRERGRLICIREDHTGGTEAINTIVSIPLKEGGNGRILVQGNDFYSSARLSPDGSQLAYLTWNHPNMPWDGCELWLVDVTRDGTLEHPQLIAGGPSQSVFQPEWSPDSMLHFVVESSGWWNLYRWQDGMLKALYPMDAEFGRP